MAVYVKAKQHIEKDDKMGGDGKDERYVEEDRRGTEDGDGKDKEGEKEEVEEECEREDRED